jgi:aspartate/methionine/tyrosine aminotransferase
MSAASDSSISRRHPLFTKWHPSELMEWAKSGYTAQGVYNLARSGIPVITDANSLPGGPFIPELYGHNEWGHEGLKHVIAEMYGTGAENVLIGQGASQCNFLMAGAILTDGGTAIVEAPMYQPVMRGIEVWADRIIRLPRRKEDGYQPNPEELRELITEETRLVMLTNLHNPTHAAMDGRTLADLVEIAATVGAVVMVDEVFHAMLERDHRKHGFSQGAISVNSLGKSWGLDGLRVGWAIGPEDLTHRAYRLNNLMGVNQPYMTEDLACRILSCPPAVEKLISNERTASSGRKLFDEFLEKTPEVGCFRPPAGISALVELPRGMDDQEFSTALLAARQTVVFPGSYYECPGAVRVSFGGPKEEVAEGLSRLSEMIRENV